MGVAASGNDRALYDWALDTFDDAVSRVAADGTLPLEMGRGQRALHYHLFALAPIVMLAEFGEANGENLYAAGDHAVEPRESHFLGSQEQRLLQQEGWRISRHTWAERADSNDIIWMVPYLRRFPNADGTKMLQPIKLTPSRYLGGYPPGSDYSAKVKFRVNLSFCRVPLAVDTVTLCPGTHSSRKADLAHEHARNRGAYRQL